MDIEPILIALVGLLFTGNIFFIKKLVDKVEDNNSSALRTEDALRNFDYQLKELKQDIKELRRIEIDVAVLKKTIRGDE